MAGLCFKLHNIKSYAQSGSRMCMYMYFYIKTIRTVYNSIHILVNGLKYTHTPNTQQKLQCTKQALLGYVDNPNSKCVQSK